MRRLSLPTLLIAFLVVAILLTRAFTYQVSFYQAAVKVRMGQADPSSVIYGRDAPGLKFRWPWPIESIEQYDTRLRTMDTPETEIKTTDGKNLIIGAYAVWQIEDPFRFYTRVRKVLRAEEHMRTRIAQAQAAVVGQRTLADFVNLDRERVEQNYDRFLDELRDSVAQGLRDDYGIRLVRLGVRRISLPKEVTQEVFKSMIQDRKTLAERYRQEGQSRAAAIKGGAESDALQILAFAERKAGEILATGTQASSRILAEINSVDRELFEWLRWLDTLKAVFKQKTTIFIDETSPLYAPFVNPPPTGQSPSGGEGLPQPPTPAGDTGQKP